MNKEMTLPTRQQRYRGKEHEDLSIELNWGNPKFSWRISADLWIQSELEGPMLFVWLLPISSCKLKLKEFKYVFSSAYAISFIWKHMLVTWDGRCDSENPSWPTWELFRANVIFWVLFVCSNQNAICIAAKRKKTTKIVIGFDVLSIAQYQPRTNKHSLKTIHISLFSNLKLFRSQIYKLSPKYK